MLELFVSGCTAVAGGVRMFVDALKYVARVNFELVATVVEAVKHSAVVTVSVYCQLKDLISVAAVSTADLFHEIYIVLMITLATAGRSIVCICSGLHCFYANVTSGCLLCYSYIYACCQTVAHTVIFISDILALSANISINLAITAVSTLFVTVTTVGSYCYYFVTGVWQGLGFVLSSVALFPTYCVQSLKNIWMRSLETLTNVLTVTTKETYLGIIVLCLVYLTLSNTFRYLYSKGLPLFPRRLRSRRHRDYTTHWQFDRGFESDFDDLNSSDTEDVSWVAPADTGNDSDADSDEDDNRDIRIDQDSNISENNSDADEESSAEEDTVVTEESDSDASVNSHTFSTESSDHEIEVQLPPPDKCYSLCSRSSTPSRISKTVSPEEFYREMERERDKRKCVICQDQIKSVLILPCRHMCMCVLCAGQIVRSRTIERRVCPLCRTRITKVMNVYV
ncbi:unnamed protein product [Candidula unifasciata]|uniref:RING-type domain-containing protein n=1 Tax=Candidula unifasciata TaxID=100452 RepID=A0A8S3ZRM5_9EUPU|nr:unnamed protein product [Candidula unifasciata]